MKPMIPWNSIDTALLDMDGTLLDLRYDNYFWQEHVPQRYAERREMSLDNARAELAERYRRVEGTLDWYCVDYWTRELTLDIRELKHELRHLIRIHPDTPGFLTALTAHGKRRILVTNAHGKALALKLEQTGLAVHFDDIVCAHDFGMPKEHPGFWERLQQTLPFAPARTVLIDDSLPVLRAAQRYGLAHVVAVAQPDSERPARITTEFPSITALREITPR